MMLQNVYSLLVYAGKQGIEKKKRPKTICKKKFEMINNSTVDCIPDLCLEEMLTLDLESEKGFFLKTQ